MSMVSWLAGYCKSSCPISWDFFFFLDDSLPTVQDYSIRAPRASVIGWQYGMIISTIIVYWTLNETRFHWTFDLLRIVSLNVGWNMVSLNVWFVAHCFLKGWMKHGFIEISICCHLLPRCNMFSWNFNLFPIVAMILSFQMSTNRFVDKATFLLGKIFSRKFSNFWNWKTLKIKCLKILGQFYFFKNIPTLKFSTLNFPIFPFIK